LYWNFPFPWHYGVFQNFQQSKAPPSTAYKKFHQICAFLRLGSLSGVTVSELGSYPGGWTYSLLEKGALVSSVDRAYLDDAFLRQHPNLTHHVTNAKTWKPSVPCEWLFADLAIPPTESIKVLHNWIENKYTKKFVYTIKFTGNNQFEDLSDVMKTLDSYSINYLRTIHFANHGNEVCIIGESK